MFTLSQTKSGVLLPIRVQPRAKANVIAGVRQGKLLISVSAAPAENAANTAVLGVLAKVLKIAPSRLSIARGHKSREKTICVSGLSLEEIRARLTAALPSD